MSSIASTGLFPKELIPEIFSKVSGKSSIARLSAQTPIAFSGNEIMTFSLDSDVSIVAEGGNKPAGDGTMGSVTITPVKVVYNARVNDEFIRCAEEKQIEYLRAFTDGFAKKIARGVDIMAFHGLNPASKATSSIIGTNCFDRLSGVDKVVSTAAEADITAAIAGLGAGYTCTGIAMSPTFSTALSQTTYAGGQKPYEDFMWGGNPGAVRGIPADVNETVGVSASTAVYDYAVLGDFQNAFKWGFSEIIPLEVIEYGNPDGGAADLKQANQVLLRTEAYVGWGIIDPDAFAVIVNAEE